ncbi:hypothetical protein [Litchfieldella rifensis]|uniref:Uncharacterized protein n=1 Tax=Litchfieldella rifensis TaxID=762643 RepID=A0ABV7LRG3_9GAMM
MHDSVDGVHTLLGSRLRDARRGREGRIVGIDQTQPTPALLIVWASGQGAERVGLSREELQALVEASVSRQTRKQPGDDGDVTAPDSPDVVSLAIGSSKQS